MSQPRARRPDFKVIARNEAEENAYDYVSQRTNVKHTSVFGSVAHIVKGALGGGILGGHVAYLKGGLYVSLFLNVFFGFYMGYCLHLLVQSAQILYKRTQIPSMSYPDVGEASVACFPNPKVAKLSKLFRYIIDVVIIVDLYGACACYQLIIAKSIKQLVEDVERTDMEGVNGHPHLKVYLAAMIIPMVLICLITHLKWLAPFSVVANFVVLLAMFATIYYSMQVNPGFANLKSHSDYYETLEFTGMIVFSMSCAGIVIPIENNMAEPKKFPLALFYGMFLIVLGTIMVSFFGYVGYLDKSESPITVNFPMTTFPKILKGLIAVMIYVTHALNFWPPFNLCFYYLQKCHPENKVFFWELVYRAIFVIVIAIVAIVFPNINSLMGFLGSVCLSNMAFIWPCLINILVLYERPGFGKYRWRLWRNLVMIAVGIFLLICGGLVNVNEMISVFIQANL
ncbi:unnamed protein product [Chilo suppressalis]|uniref:Amino acid transporter transmembrane domain-containing protein n=1 Tax=Chilo suppressalis TaxID=168631 RepID=A0ABN8B660_CHISP|nr:unnamed protein product [Chilo suppressalis]